MSEPSTPFPGRTAAESRESRVLLEQARDIIADDCHCDGGCELAEDGPCTCRDTARSVLALAVGRLPVEGTEWFWRIVDAAGLNDVPSDEEAALQLLARKAAEAGLKPSTAPVTGE